MMFASDLDRTLIYSNRALSDYGVEEDIELVTVEQKLDQKVSFMSAGSLAYLQRISSKLLFVPVTTRSYEQYRRVLLPNTLQKYAVTSNGANILYEGMPLVDWKNKISKDITNSSMHLGEIIEQMKDNFYIPGEMRTVEQLFVYYYLSDRISSQLVQEIACFLAEKGWRVSYQGNKFYLMPLSISKGEAVRFIQEREGISTLIGAGDSSFDDDFLRICQYPFVLGHGELAQKPLKEHYQVIKEEGVKGGEMLLNSILKLIEKIQLASTP
ncbi:HAD family hydrolase [Robertmurraya andreesenii]|uniref:Hydroxymethylpyrimidine pyrophosphatase-like HAD family hydrolase n=1 Tax=Anoxybacillus andreesenii TaxID=1325932 RepID=A0ABT9V2F1_9BACL|nr:HAD family hydrolase [Robertmurraya andreesenii]MDQ0155121.1 hydroxymethylpyrimidine pyrophosphatase-like HAD family hydrolase [Robertmurraya andreesenii]